MPNHHVSNTYYNYATNILQNNNLTKDFPEGSTLLDIYNGFNLSMPYGPVSAKVNNKVEGLNFKVYYNKDVEFLDITSSSGMRTYFRSLCFILVKAVEELYPQGSISLEHPVSKGYYCTLHLDRPIGLDDVTRIKQKMQEIITEDIPFQRIECHTEQAVELFSQRSMLDKAKLLKTSGQLYTFITDWEIRSIAIMAVWFQAPAISNCSTL